MINVTEAAATHLVDAARDRGLPEDVAVRLYGQPDSEGKLVVGVSFTRSPGDDDVISQQRGTQVCVAPEVAAVLETASLDVKDTPEGPRLVLKRRAGPA